MTIPMPRLPRYSRILPLLYALSAAMRAGKRLGRPLPDRLIAPPPINVSNIVDSCCCPGVSSNTTGLPLPSHRTCILVEYPPLLRPKASSSGLVGFWGSPFLLRLHVDGHALRSYLYNVLTTGLRLWHRHPVVAVRVSSATRPAWSSDRSGWLPSARGRIARVNLAKEHQFCLSTAFH